MTDFVDRAVIAFQQAVQADKAEDWPKAHQMYKEAASIFIVAIKYEKNEERKKSLRGKTDEALNRAKEIEDVLHGNGGGGNNGNTKQRTKKAGDVDDDEKRRMRGGLEGAIVKEKPNVSWSSVAGLDGAKAALQEAVILPVRFPQLFTGSRKPWRGILLYGPPGTGKSYLAKAVATETDGTFLSVSSSDLMSRWLGDSEKLVRNLFEMARDAFKETGKPTTIFIDEIDSLCSSRSEGENDAVRRIKTEFLVQMQGVGHDDHGVLVLAATNIPWNIDSAVRRRFERRIYIALPDVRARAAMFKLHLGDTPHHITDAQFYSLAEKTEMYSGSDINVLVRNAMMECVRSVQVATHFKTVEGPDPKDPQKRVANRLVPCSPGDPAALAMTLMQITTPELVMPMPVVFEDFVKAIRTAKSSVGESDLQQYEAFTREFGQEG